MRFIDLSALVLPAGWETKSVNALIALKTKNNAERSAYIASMQASIWKDENFVKALLFLVSKRIKKCWYSESRITDDVDIDHFRPKGRNPNTSFYKQYEEHLSEEILDMVDADSNNGWWFLAFEYTNFRVCSCYRNQLRHDLLLVRKFERAKGKSAFFPLKKGSPNAINLDGLIDEINCLLDPCNPEDPQYLFFDSIGRVDTLHNDTWIKCRVSISKVLYHLDEIQLEDCRRQKWLECKTTIIEKFLKLLKLLVTSMILNLLKMIFLKD